MRKSRSFGIAISLFIILQIIKPLAIMFIYKQLTNFHPTIVNNYEIYLMVLEHILRGSMKASYTAAFILSEVLFITVPILFYRKMKDYKIN